MWGLYNKFSPEVLDGLSLEPHYRALKSALSAYLGTLCPSKYVHLSNLPPLEADRFFQELSLEGLPLGSLERHLLSQVKAVEAEIMKSREIHRQQDHHKMWNGFRVNPLASKSMLLYGATDTVIALLESRSYYGGAHTLEEYPVFLVCGSEMIQKRKL